MVEKRKLDPIKSMVSVQSSTRSLNFMVTAGIVSQTSFLMKTLHTQLSKMKMITPSQSRIFMSETNNVYKICKTKFTPSKSSGKEIGKLSSLNGQKLEPI